MLALHTRNTHPINSNQMKKCIRHWRREHEEQNKAKSCCLQNIPRKLGLCGILLVRVYLKAYKTIL